MDEIKKSIWEAILEGIWKFFGVALVFLGFLLIIGQVLLFLYSGEWLSLPMIMLIPEPLASWLGYPQQWIGLSNMLSTLFNVVPLSAFLLILGFYIATSN